MALFRSEIRAKNLVILIVPINLGAVAHRTLIGQREVVSPLLFILGVLL